MPGEPGLSIVTYTADEHSESAEKFAVLASWAARGEDDAEQNRRHMTVEDA